LTFSEKSSARTREFALGDIDVTFLGGDFFYLVVSEKGGKDGLQPSLYRGQDGIEIPDFTWKKIPLKTA
jgi:hypothetical protein